MRGGKRFVKSGIENHTTELCRQPLFRGSDTWLSKWLCIDARNINDPQKDIYVYLFNEFFYKNNAICGLIEHFFFLISAIFFL